MKSLSLLICLLLGLSITGHAEPDYEETQIKTIPVNSNIYMLEGKGGNIGLSVGEDGTLIVDDQFAPLSEKIKAAIKELSEDNTPKYIINTHWHFDHTGGNAAFGRDGAIVAHSNVRKLLEEDQYISFFEKEVKAQPKHGLPSITFDQSLSLHFNNDEIQITHFPSGHTNGDSIVYFKNANVVHLGDHYFNGFYPFVDLEHGGSVQGMMRNVEKILNDLPEDVKIIPGHGPLSNKEELKVYHSFLKASLDYVTEKIDSGNTLEAIQKEGMPKEWESWASGFLSTEKWLSIVYSSLAQERLS